MSKSEARSFNLVWEIPKPPPEDPRVIERTTSIIESITHQDIERIQGTYTDKHTVDFLVMEGLIEKFDALESEQLDGVIAHFSLLLRAFTLVGVANMNQNDRALLNLKLGGIPAINLDTFNPPLRVVEDLRTLWKKFDLKVPTNAPMGLFSAKNDQSIKALV